MDALTLENLFDLREAVQKRIKEVQGATFHRFEHKEREEQARRLNSLLECLKAITERIADDKFEAERNPLPF